MWPAAPSKAPPPRTGPMQPNLLAGVRRYVRRAALGLWSANGTAGALTPPPVALRGLDVHAIGVEGACMTDTCASGSWPRAPTERRRARAADACTPSSPAVWTGSIDQCPGNCDWGKHYRGTSRTYEQCEAEARSPTTSSPSRTPRGLIGPVRERHGRLLALPRTQRVAGLHVGRGKKRKASTAIGCTYRPQSDFSCYLRTPPPLSPPPVAAVRGPDARPGNEADGVQYPDRIRRDQTCFLMGGPIVWAVALELPRIHDPTPDQQ